MEIQLLWLLAGILLGGFGSLLWRRSRLPTDGVEATMGGALGAESVSQPDPESDPEPVSQSDPEPVSQSDPEPDAESDAEHDAESLDIQLLAARYYQALELAQFKGGFLARTAHELRSPLSSLMGLHQLILEDLCDSPEEERECVAQAYEAAQNFYGLLDTLIEVSQLELGRKSLDLQPLELDLLLEDVTTSVRLPLADRNVCFRVVPWESQSGDRTTNAPNPQAVISPAITADYGCLRQISIQLILLAAEQKATQIIWKCVASADGEHIGFVLSDNRDPELWQATLTDWAQLEAREDRPTAELSLDLKRQWQPAQLSPELSLWVQRSLLESMGGRLELLAGSVGMTAPTTAAKATGLNAFLESPPPQDQLCCWLTRA